MPKTRLQTTILDTPLENISLRHRETKLISLLPSSAHDDIIPIPVQTFLWRQSNPFLKQKFGKLTDASAIIFHRVLVQNILHGLPPSLTDAISNISRWLLIKAAFPHVMHACSSVIEHNLHHIQQQSIASTHPSLLINSSSSRSLSISTQLQVPSSHQLPVSLNPTTISNEHQSLLVRLSSPINSTESHLFHTLHYLILYSNENEFLSLNTIELFIYLFIPYIQTYFHNNEKEFLSHPDLVQGMRLIWQPLFEHHQPNIRIFNSFVKANQQEQIVSIEENNHQPYRLSVFIKSPIQRSVSEKQILSDLSNQVSSVKPEKILFQPKIKIDREQKFNQFIHVHSDSIGTIDSSLNDLSGYETGNNNSKLQAPIVHMNSICSMSDLNRLTVPSQKPVAVKVNSIPVISSSISTPSSPLRRRYSQQPSPIPQVYPTTPSSLSHKRTSEYLLLATYFDIGIIRTLFSPSWLTDGYIWCLEYLNKRIIDISDEILSDAFKNGISPINILRFKSLSVPQINPPNEQNYYKYLKNNYFNEQITNDIIEQQCSMTTTTNSIKRSNTLLNKPMTCFPGYCKKSNNFHKKIREKQLTIRSNIHYIDEEGIEHLDLATDDHQNNFGISLSSSKNSRLHLIDSSSLRFKTSTIHSTDTILQSIDASNSTRKTSATAPITNLNAMKTYSMSDSEINYKFLEDIQEAQGSSGYVNRSGTINFSVVLAGIHAVACKENHLKVCELVMNILDVLFGLDIISSVEDDMYRKQLLNSRNRDLTTIENEHIEEWLKRIDAKEDEKFQLAVDIILRILKRLGCSNCQPAGRNFVTDQLRGKVRLSLNKLRLLNQHRFEKCFLNFATNGSLVHILDILHALCGYCSESNIELAHYAPYISIKPDIHSRQTYSNNFNNTHLGIGPKDIDGFILNIIFKSFVTRLNTMDKYLLASENMTLYSECRAFLIYMKENHGGTFRVTLFSSLIDPQKKLRTMQMAFNRNLSDDINGHIDQELTTEEDQSTMNMKLKNTRQKTRSSTDGDGHSLYVDLTLVRMGLLRLNFLIKSCPPGSLPDPQFLNSLLFLDAPVISKAAFLIECAYFVRRCSLGQWPEWMRLTITTFRPQDASTGRITNTRLNKIYQAAAARMFYIWGEALSSQLETILNTEQQQQQNSSTSEETFDDYYNEAIINRSGHDCPYSLQLTVCLLLYEITSFLRETYETLPKLSSLSTAGVHFRQQPRTAIDASSTTTDKGLSDRFRMGSVVSQLSNRSTTSLSYDLQPLSPNMLSATVINMNPSVNERHISFAIKKENDLNENNHTTIAINDNDVTDDGSSIVLGTSKSGSIGSTSKLNRRGSAKLRKPSVRMKDGGKHSHRSSFRNRRRSHASNLSTETDAHQTNAAESTDVHGKNTTNEHNQENFDDTIHTRPFPWIKHVIQIFNNISLTCDHQQKCLSNCYDKQTKSCKNLLNALLNLYQLSAVKHHDIIPNRKQRFSTYLFGDQVSDSPKEKEINLHFNDLSTYLEKQVGSLIQIPLMILCKSSVVLEDEHYSQVLRLSWELLLDRNEELSACAATIVILTAARASHLVDRLIHIEMENSSALIRYNAILKFQVLWRFRYQFWVRLEESAHSMMKIFPPSIEFVLPSPVLGIANLQIVDPPWMPHVKSLVQQVALNQEEVRAVVTTSKTRKKHQQELIHSALMTEEISKRVARENFTMSTVSMLQAASFEPLLHQSRDEEEEGHVDDDRVVETSVQLRQAQGTFPSAFGAAIFQLVEMLEDEEIIENGAVVSGAARKALWTCLLDEPTLLIRFFFEKLSHKERRTKSLQSLRHLMIYLTDIPPQFAHAIFNYVLGLLLSIIRSPFDGSQELLIAGLTLLWQIIPYLHGLVLKDFKQSLRKEQAEMMILITGNIPSTKKVIIHGPDASQIPTQAIIAEDTQFTNVLQEALEFFGIPEAKRDRHYLIDVKTQQIHIPDTYVRDFYFFRRNIHPQLSLVYMDIKQSQRQFEQVSICLKTIELSKVLFARYLLENTPFNQIQNCITFFHDELIKSPLFPRKPLESDFNLYTKISDKELFHLDMLHKYNWVKLISCIFLNMDGKTTTTWDITLFLSVINGSFILHCEDLVMLRFCLATYINIVKHFRHIFATNGYLLIMPTFLRVYSNIQSNPILKKTVEYCCRQFFILHRIPFILQMLGSVSHLLDFDEHATISDTNKIQPIALFRLLIALEQTGVDATHDDYSVLELVKNDSLLTKTIVTSVGNVTGSGQGAMLIPTSIKSLDFCYADDDAVFTFLNCFDVCVSVVAYSPDSIRSLQMLGIIDILLPKYLEYIKDRTSKNDFQKYGRDEIKIIEKLSISIKTIVHVSESLTRTFVEPKCDTSVGTHYKHSRTSYRAPSIVPDEDSASRFIDDRGKSRPQDTDERNQASEFRWPRDTVLSIISKFIQISTQRLRELLKQTNDPTLRHPELLDAKLHTRLADITYTLLKLGGYDPVTISCRGIQNYFQRLLPFTNWNEEPLRPILNLLLRRIDRMFLKICKKPMIKRFFDWGATAGILNGIYLTIDRYPSIAYYPNLKALISGCIALILNENIIESNHSVPRLETPTFPTEFSHAVIKLVGRYLLALKEQPNLEALTSHSWSSTNTPSTINHLIHFLVPLMFWASSTRKDATKIHPIDVSYIITILLNSVKLPSKLASTMGTQSAPPVLAASSGKQYLTVGEGILSNSSSTHKSMRQLKDLLQIASLLGLKVLIIGFSKQLKREWQRIISAIKSMCNKQSNISSNLLSFIDFIVTYKTPIYVIFRPFLLHYMHSVTSENDRDYEMITSIQQKLIFEKIVPSKSISEILNELMQELNQLKAELIDDSKTSSLYDIRPTGTEKVRFDTDALEQIKDHDVITVQASIASDERLNNSRTTNVNRFRRQQLSDTSLNTSSNKRTEKIRVKDALDILATYHARYKIRCNASNSNTHKDLPLKCLSSMTSDTAISDMSHPPLALLRSVTLASDRSPVSVDRTFQYCKPINENIPDPSAVNNDIQIRLRTFRGWKRNTAHLDKPRLTKCSLKPHIASEPSMAYDATKEMNDIFRPIRHIDEQQFVSVTNEQNSNSNEQTVTTPIPLTEIGSRQTESHRKT